MKRKLVVILASVLLVGCNHPAHHHHPKQSAVGADREPTAQVGRNRCGRERWNVKTATDANARNINLSPKDTTIVSLIAQPSTNPGNPDQPRDSGIESQVFRVTATLQFVKQEADSDFHLALADDQGHTMIAEIPNAPACTESPVTSGNSVLEKQIEQARTSFVQQFGQPTPNSWTSINKKVTITGVGFYDVLHGQRNVAPNAIELHPVLSIQSP